MIKKNKDESSKKTTYDVIVSRVKAFDDNNIACDLIVNGVTIYGCVYKQGVKEGREYAFISFPSKKSAKDDSKYYAHAFFPISQDLLADIEKQIEAKLSEVKADE